MTEPKINEKMSIEEIVKKYPKTVDVFSKHGLHCIGCQLAQYEDLQAGAKAHGLDVEKLLDDLNKAIN